MLVMHGEKDKPSTSQRFIDTISASDKTLDIVQGSGHEVLNGVAKDEALATLFEWLKTRIPTR